MQLYLFDMDAVLVHPGGYHAALTATVNHFARAMGHGDFGPGPEAIEIFEAAGITSEWDSAPIAVAEIARTGRRPDYAALVRRVSAEWRKGEYAAEAAYRLIAAPARGAQPPDPSPGGHTAGAGSPIAFDDLLLHSRDIHRSPVLAVFQQFTLGQAFEATYGMPCTIQTEALLLKHDRPALTRTVPPRSAIYTARPCRPPRDVSPRPGYAPEAELGAQLVGLGRLPLVGFGSFQWLAETLDNGAQAEHYLKPSPVHGLAAMAAASGARESASLLAAEAAARGEWISPLKELRGLKGRVFVFEDSARSIEGVREAARMLGDGWACTGIGIAAGGPKRAALLQVADRVYASLDDAIDAEIESTPP
jgi:hypothetical protein